MKPQKLPDWAQRALATHEPDPENSNSQIICRYKAVFDRVTTGWSELEVSFVPALKTLSALEKQRVFEQAIWAAICLPPRALSPRSVKAKIESTHEDIKRTATKLVGLLEELDSLGQGGVAREYVPSLLDVVERASQAHPEWASVAKDDLKALLRNRGQSRPSPTFQDAMEAFVQMVDETQSSLGVPYLVFNDHNYSPVSLALFMTAQMTDEILGLQGFKLHDVEVAALVSVLLGVNYSAEALRVARNRQKPKRQNSKHSA